MIKQKKPKNFQNNLKLPKIKMAPTKVKTKIFEKSD